MRTAFSIWSGSIPARAGEPSSRRSSTLITTVYPRACGGTADVAFLSTKGTGLSPRVRGNPPPAKRGRARNKGLSPRVRGTASVPTLPLPTMGLSPRVRGNRLHAARNVQLRGSIPARAGEPKGFAPPPLHLAVYPRACGGTPRRNASASVPTGLSPRVRGNHVKQERTNRPLGSIPARAGEPARKASLLTAIAVYPRACGGTSADHTSHSKVQGLSPRVRGTPTAFDPTPRFAGLSPRVRGNHDERAHGNETDRSIPRVRGNRGADQPCAGPPGSIPARAGEPSVSALTITAARVYPRACGGTIFVLGIPDGVQVYPRACGGTRSSRSGR